MNYTENIVEKAYMEYERREKEKQKLTKKESLLKIKNIINNDK